MKARRSTATFANEAPAFPNQCAAANRSGNRCGRHAEPGAVVCSLHGGKSLKGISHPAYRTGDRVQSIGRYTLSEADQQGYERFLRERGELLKSNDEMALLITRVQSLLDRTTHSAKTQPEGDSWTWEEIRATIDAIRRLRAVEVRRIATEQDVMSADQAKLFMSSMMQIAIDVCAMAPDRATEVRMRNHFAAEVEKLIHKPTVG